MDVNIQDKNFHISLFKKDDLKLFEAIEGDDNIVFLNSDYIVSVFHIMLAINSAAFNYKNNKTKADRLKKEIIYYTTTKNKINLSLKAHLLHEASKAYYIVLIEKSKNEIDQIKKSLTKSGANNQEIYIENYTNYLNQETLMKEFDITANELNNNEISKIIYNKLAIKDLK